MVIVFACNEIAGDQPKYQNRLEKYFDFIEINGKTIKEKDKIFVEKPKVEVVHEPLIAY